MRKRSSDPDGSGCVGIDECSNVRYMRPQSKIEDLFLVGHVVRPHGVHGELKVAPETDDLARLEAIRTLYVGRTPEQSTLHSVEAIRFQTTKRGPLALVKLEGVNTREAAGVFNKLQVFADVNELPSLTEGEVFIHDLIGLAVLTEDGQAVGVVEDVLQTPAHATYVVHREEGTEVLVPAVEAFIADVDLDAGQLVIRPIEGLI